MVGEREEFAQFMARGGNEKFHLRGLSNFFPLLSLSLA